ncbi:MAG: DUF3575 domain-containing protein [Alistipes sp.]|nr:DUF3575 domain-containing protein [Alistipes sp.]
MLLAGTARGQEVGIKTNLLYGATTTPNLGVEIKLGTKTTLDLVGTYNPFTFSHNIKVKNWTVQPEIRLWTCEAFNRGFWGFHLTGGGFNAGNVNLPLGVFPQLDDHRFEGYMAGGGVSYGWQWYLGPHWNLEATFGFGYLYLNYDKYECAKCGEKLGHETKHYFGPTRIGVSFIYLFGSKK